MFLRSFMLALVCLLSESSLITIIRKHKDEFTKSEIKCKDCFKLGAKCSGSNSSLDLCRCHGSGSYFSTYVFGKNPPCVADKELLGLDGGNEHCLSWKSDRDMVQIVDFSSHDTSKSFDMLRYKSCHLPHNDSFEHQQRNGTWKTTNYSRKIFKLIHWSELQILGSPDLQAEFSGHLVKVDLKCYEKPIFHPGLRLSNRCLVFKVKGKFIYPRPPAPSPTPNGTLTTTTTTTSSISVSNTSVEALKTVAVLSPHGPSAVAMPTSVPPSVIRSIIGFGANDEKDDRITTAVIGVVGAVVCVLIICAFAWLNIRRRRKRRTSLNADNEYVGRNLPALPNGAVLRKMRQSLQEDHIYCELSEFSPTVRRKSCPEGPKLDTPDDSPSLLTDNNLQSYDNNGFVSENQQDDEQCTVPEGQTQMITIDGSEKENSEEDLGQEKLFYQCLKTSDTSRLSIYEPLVRTGSVTETTAEKEEDSMIDNPNCIEEPKDDAHDNSRKKPNHSTKVEIFWQEGEAASCNVLEGTVSSDTEEKTDDSSDNPEYFVLDGPEPGKDSGGTDTTDHDYHVLEAPESLPGPICNGMNEPLSGSDCSSFVLTPMEEVRCITEGSDNFNAPLEIEEIGTDYNDIVETPPPLELSHFDKENYDVSDICVTAKTTTVDLTKRRGNLTECEHGNYVFFIKHGDETSLNNKLCNQPCGKNGDITSMASLDEVCMKNQVDIDIEQNHSKTGETTRLNDASPLGTYNRQMPILSPVTTKEEFF